MRDRRGVHRPDGRPPHPAAPGASALSAIHARFKGLCFSKQKFSNITKIQYKQLVIFYIHSAVFFLLIQLAHAEDSGTDAVGYVAQGSLAAVLFCRVPTQSKTTHASARKHVPCTIISKGRVFKKLRQKNPKSLLTVYYLPVTHSLFTHCNNALPLSFCTLFDLSTFHQNVIAGCHDFFLRSKPK